MDFLDLPGPQFLVLFIPLLAVSIAMGLLMRAVHSFPGGAGEHPEITRDAYALAYLAGGPERAVQAALASLTHAGALVMEGKLLRAADPAPWGDTTFEAAMHDVVASRAGLSLGPGTPKLLGPTVTRHLVGMAARLEEAGLLLTRERRDLAVLIGVSPVALVLFVGVAKVAIGLGRGRPVSFLVVLCLVALLAIRVLWSTAPARTGGGNRVLAAAQKASRALETAVARPTAVLGAGDLAMAVAVFGMPVVQVGQLALMGAMMTPVPASSSGESSSSSSCGGGGGCGGGCGGCGG